MKKVLLICIILLSAIISQAQVAGDFKTTGWGNWTDYTKWLVFDGTNWNAAILGQIPTETSNVYIQTGAQITLTANAACNDIHIGASYGDYDAASNATAKILLGTYTLRVSGKMRCYKGALPGTTINSRKLWTFPFVSTTGGKVSVVGNSRALISASEWNANINNATSGGTFRLDLDLNEGQTVTIASNFKLSQLNINTGTLSSTAAIFFETGTAAQGDLTIASGATFISTATNTMLRLATPTPAGTFTNNGTFIIGAAVPLISMSTIVNNGTIEYNRAGVQTLLAAAGTGSASLDTYNNLKLSGTSAKTLALATTVTGKLTIAETASLNLNSLALTYGASSTLEYAGSAAQTMSNVGTSEWSASPTNLTINNALGVIMADLKSISGILSLTNGVLSIDNNNLTIGSSGSISGGSTSSYIATTGTGSLIQDVASGVSKTFPIGASASNSYDPTTLTVTTGTTVSAKVSSILTYHNLSVPSSIYLNPREWTITPTVASSTILSLTPSELNILQGIYSGISGPEGYDSNASNYIFSPATKSGNTFTATYSDFTNPFITASTDVSTSIYNNDILSKIVVFSQNGKLNVKGVKAGDKVEVFNSLGMRIMSTVAKDGDNLFELKAKGILVVKVNNGQNKIIL